MSFLAALLALLLDQALRHLEWVRSPRWFQAYAEALQSFTCTRDRIRASTGVLLMIMVPAVAVLFLDGLLTHGRPGPAPFWDALGFLFYIAVFWFCLGPRDIHTQAETYMEASQTGNEAKAAEAAREILEIAPPASSAERTQAVTRAVFKEANARIFGVLFWFGLLGPAGAVLYRCADLTARKPFPGESEEFRESAVRTLGVLAWIPAHL